MLFYNIAKLERAFEREYVSTSLLVMFPYPSDFRPISLLCFLSNVLKKIAHDQIVEFLTLSQILDPYQTSFKKFHSIHSALLKLTDDIRLDMDRKLATLLLRFDFSKAFDTISPSKLLKKFQVRGFSKSALQWLWSYLYGHSQCVLQTIKL